MAFIATNESPVSVYPSIKSIAGRVRQVAVTAQSAIAGGVNADQLLGLMRNMRQSLDSLNSLTVVPGLEQYAKDQEGDQTYDVVGEYTTMKAQMIAVGQWIATNLPKDADGYVLLYTISGTELVPRTFTSQQLSALSALLQDLIDAIAV